jgi:fatty acid desaturase
MTILDDVKSGRLTIEEAREKIRRKARRNDAIASVIVGAMVALGVVSVLAWQVFLPVVGLLWLFGGLS